MRLPRQRKGTRWWYKGKGLGWRGERMGMIWMMKKDRVKRAKSSRVWGLWRMNERTVRSCPSNKGWLENSCAVRDSDSHQSRNAKHQVFKAFSCYSLPQSTDSRTEALILQSSNRFPITAHKLALSVVIYMLSDHRLQSPSDQIVSSPK